MKNDNFVDANTNSIVLASFFENKIVVSIKTERIRPLRAIQF